MGLSRTGLLLAGLGAGLALLVAAAAGRPPRETFLLGGIQVNESDHARWFAGLETAGMNTVSVTTYAKQGDWDSDNLWWDEEDPGLMREIRGARARGLRVVLILRVALDDAFPRNRFLWHGMIVPEGDAHLDAWFARYRRFVLKWAAVAAREGVTVLGVGSELSHLTSTVPLDTLPALESYFLDDAKQAERRALLMEHEAEVPPEHLYVRGHPTLPSLDVYLDQETAAHHAWARAVTFDGAPDALERMNRRRARLEAHWRSLIRDVRTVYPGLLTYAANFDQYGEVGFWDALDLIGVNAYFSLREASENGGDGGLLPVLERRWDALLGEMDDVRRERGAPTTPYLFTEIGYTSRRGCTVEPWAAFGFTLVDDRDLVVWKKQPPAPGERALALQALAEACRRRGDGLLRGLLYWKLTTDPAHRDIEPFVHVLGDDHDPLSRVWSRFRGLR